MNIKVTAFTESEKWSNTCVLSELKKVLRIDNKFPSMG